MKYEKLSQYAKRHSVTYRTAWNRFKAGKIPGAFVGENSNQILVPIVGQTALEDKNKVAIYCRVSSSENKTNLQAQAERLTAFATAKGYTIVAVVKEVGSGVNDKRKKLQALLQDESWGTLLVEHKDRLTRFGFNYFTTLLDNLGKQVEVVNIAEDNSSDLMQDLVSVIYSFSARMYGLRRSKRKTEAIIKCLTEQENLS